MNRHRRSAPVIAALAVALSLTVPAAAPASSLLSGYGGPGAGNQVLIGSTLINGSGGGGGGGLGGQPGEAPGSLRYGEQLGAGGSGGSSSTGAGSHSRGTQVRSGPPHSRQARAGEASGGAVRAYPSGRTSRAVASTTLGLSGSDLLYILLVLAGLALTMILSRWLTHAAETGGYRR